MNYKLLYIFYIFLNFFNFYCNFYFYLQLLYHSIFIQFNFEDIKNFHY